MLRLLRLGPLSVILLVLRLPPQGGALSATIDQAGAAAPAAPEASAPLPPRLTPPPEASAPLPPLENPPHPASETAVETPSAEKLTLREQAQGSSRPPPAKSPPSQPGSTATPVRSRAPEPQRKQPSLETSPFTTEAANFINAYWANVGGTSDQVLPYLASIYAPIVNYYGKPTAREAILRDKSNFIHRWPIRQTWVPPDEPAPSIICSNTTAQCEVTGVRDFDAASPGRGVRSIGAVRYTYTVRFIAGVPQIMSEDSKVVSRE